MTALEMKYEFLLNYDRIASQAAPGYNNMEISTFLTQSQENFIKTRYSGSNKYGTGFEESEKRRKDISNLVKYVTLVPSTYQVGVYPNGVMYELPIIQGTEVFVSIAEQVLVSSDDTCVDGTIIDIKAYTHNQYNANIKNPFKKPYSQLVWRIDSGLNPNTGARLHQLIGDGTYTLGNYYFKYIKKPRPVIIPTVGSTKTIDNYPASVQLDCELDSETHREVVSDAIRIASGVVQQQTQYQIQGNENIKTE